MKGFLASCLVLLLTACSAETINKHAENSEQATTINLKRIYQRVKHFDCDGRVISDQLDTISSPTEAIYLPPADPENVLSSYYENLTLGTTPRCVVNRFQFHIDYSDGWCNMRVTSGLNKIKYKFTYCDEYLTDGNCAHTPYVKEEGTTLINVKYTTETHPGFSEVHPPEQACQSP